MFWVSYELGWNKSDKGGSYAPSYVLQSDIWSKLQSSYMFEIDISIKLQLSHEIF